MKMEVRFLHCGSPTSRETKVVRRVSKTHSGSLTKRCFVDFLGNQMVQFVLCFPNVNHQLVSVYGYSYS